jgi:hypothetical protein
MPLMFNPLSSMTGSPEDPLASDPAWHSTSITGADIGFASGDLWATRFELSGLRVQWEANPNVAFPFVIRFNVDDQVSPDVLLSCARAVTQAWNSTAYVSPALRFADLLFEASELNVDLVGRRYEVQATLTAPVVSSPVTESPAPRRAGASVPADATSAPHARLARELREMTGLGAAVLGSVFGVSREQYSRWISGKPISDVRHGQLQFLHTVVRELVRRLGPNQARAWLHKPLGDLTVPVDLLRDRQLDRFYRSVTSLQEPESLATRSKIALTFPAPAAEDEEGRQDPWSPYDQPESQGGGIKDG